MQKEKRGAGMEKEEGAIESPCRQQEIPDLHGLGTRLAHQCISGPVSHLSLPFLA